MDVYCDILIIVYQCSFSGVESIREIKSTISQEKKIAPYKYACVSCLKSTKKPQDNMVWFLLLHI